jgi:hypothetical protein
MKKFTNVILIFAFAFLLVGSASAVVSNANSINSRAEVAKERGLDNPASRIEAVIRKIEEMDKDIDVRGLRNALENILRRRENRYCYQIERGLEFEDEGEEVEVLQNALRREGFYRKGSENSFYGWDTAKAIYEYQEKNDIDLDNPMERMGFELSEKTRTELNEKYDCEEEEKDKDEDDEDEDEDDEDKKVVEDCERDSECGWVSTNCCPENAGANWECVNKEETDLECDEDVVCPQVVSPKPTTSCQCDDGECEEYEEDEDNDDEDEEDDDDE